MPQVDDALRERFLDNVAEQLAIAAAVQGLVIARVSQDHVRRSLERVDVRRALKLSHILSIEGHRYCQWLPHHAARQEGKMHNDPAKHTHIMQHLGKPSYYLDLELPMLQQHNGVNAIPKCIAAP